MKHGLKNLSKAISKLKEFVREMQSTERDQAAMIQVFELCWVRSQYNVRTQHIRRKVEIRTDRPLTKIDPIGNQYEPNFEGLTLRTRHFLSSAFQNYIDAA